MVTPTTHQNIDVLRGMDEAMMRQDFERMFAAYADDVLVHIGGHNKLSGDYRGVDKLQALFGRFMEAAGEFTFDPHDYLANDEHGVILQRSHYRKGGDALDTNDTFVFHFHEGTIAEFWMS